MTVAPSLAHVLRIADVLARGLSDGRRRKSRPMLGDGRGFATDLHCIYVPWPLPGPITVEMLPCAIALQCSPTKERLREVALAHLNPRERAALQYVEGAFALGWAISQWPGLATGLYQLAPGVIPETLTDVSARALLERALEHSRQRAPITVPAVFGQLPIVRSALTNGAARRSQLESRLPWSLKKRLERLNTWSVAIGGGSDSDESAKRAAPIDAEGEERTLEQRRARLGFPYPEWDVFAGRYRYDFVTVFETRVERVDKAPNTQKRDPRLSTWLEQPLERRWKHRLEDGSDIDVEALIDRRLEELTGQRHSECLYRERLPAARDVACALLIDRSGSLAKAELLNHEVACANALASAMDHAGERYGVFAFWSDSRHHVAFEVLRDFDDSRPLQLRPADLRPQGYTRIGAALRHAIVRLQGQPANRRVLLVLGDGVPCDEGYEGSYASADVAKAVEEAEMSSITIAFIALGRPADDPLAEALPRHFTRIDGMAQLAPVLADVHSRLVS